MVSREQQPFLAEMKQMYPQADGKHTCLFQTTGEQNRFMAPYEHALEYVHTVLSRINLAYQQQSKNAPLHHIDARIKTMDSLMEKLQRRGFPAKAESLSQIYDIAGLRGVCYYIDDIYEISKYIKSQHGFQLIKETDYIKNPKENGYRSLHLVVSVPVPTSNGERKIPVEIQLRTLGMDFWASLEHQIVYKSQKYVSPEIREQLRVCAEVVEKTDHRMRTMHHMVQNNTLQPRNNVVYMDAYRK